MVGVLPRPLLGKQNWKQNLLPQKSSPQGKEKESRIYFLIEIGIGRSGDIASQRDSNPGSSRADGTRCAHSSHCKLWLTLMVDDGTGHMQLILNSSGHWADCPYPN